MTFSADVRDGNELVPVARPAAESELPVVVALDDSARMNLERQKGGLAWLSEHPPVEELMSLHACEVLVVEFVGDVLGFSVSFDIDDRIRGRICRIDRVYVDEAAREVGCGDALIMEVVRRARRRSCRFVEAVALPGDRETKNLYERAGITARSIIVSKEISDPSIGVPASR